MTIVPAQVSACRCRPEGRPVGRRRLYRRPRRFAAHRPGRHAPAPGGPGPRPHRPQRLGQVDLARALVGVWPTLRGEIRLDGAALDQWEPDPLGRNIGYLPQDVELFEGTIAENISRFQPDAKPEDVIAAADRWRP